MILHPLNKKKEYTREAEQTIDTKRKKEKENRHKAR